MSNYTTETKIKQMLSSDLQVDYEYQRPVNENRVRSIVKRFNKLLVNDIKVSQRDDGKCYIFDGQHTKTVLERMNGAKPIAVRCKVYRFEGVTDDERIKIEAELFAEQNGLSQKVDILHKLRAKYIANDTEIVKFFNLTNSTGLKMDFNQKRNNRVGEISCYAELLKSWKTLGDEQYTEMLKTIKEIWGGNPDSLRAEIIGGMTLFTKEYQRGYNQARLISRLSLLSPKVIIQEGNLSRENGKSKYAKEIIKIYNKGTRNKLQ